MILDYSPTLSDVPALLYLASHPDVDLLAVTLAGTGESDCGPGVRNTAALLAIAGRPDTPVACGREAPLVGDRDWPEPWREAANTITGVVLPGVVRPESALDAVDVLVDVLTDADEPVIIVTLGPLTNLGVLVSEHPELVERIERVVTMGGAVGVEGNVEGAPAAEWNLHIDPESARLVADSGVPMLFVPLDATAYVPGGRQIPARLNQAPELTPAGEAVRQLFASNLDTISSPGWFFWDELAAVVAVDEAVATIEDITISIDDAGATIADPDGALVRVATAADPAAFMEHFIDVFSGGRVVTFPSLEPSETAYVQAVDTLDETLAVALGDALDALFGFEEDEPLTIGDLGEAPAIAFDGVFEALDNFGTGLDEIDPPNRFVSAHDQLAAGLDEMVSGRNATVSSMRSIPADDPHAPAEELFSRFEFELMEAGFFDSLEDVASACAEIELEAGLRGASVVLECAELLS